MFRNIKNVAIPFVILVIIWIIIQNLWNSLPKTPYVINILPRPWGGSPCSDKLYDYDGKGYDNFGISVNYSGPAPLYKVADQNLGLRFNDASKCFIYPQYVDPAIAQQGQPVYPVDIIADFGANSMKAGESYLLIVTTTMIDNFPQSPQWKAYMAFDKVTDLQFTMNASNFEYSPSNENVQGVPFGYNLPAVYTWSIAPLERASGEQSLIVRAVGEEASIDFGAIIVIDVRDKLGLKPSTLASVTTISFVFAYFLSQTKIFIEIMDSLGKLNVKKKK